MTEIPSCILPQFLWYNRSIKVDKNSAHVLQFSLKISVMFLNFLVTIVSLKNGMNFKENTTYENCSLQWIQSIYSMPERWKFIIKENYENATSL